MKRRFHSLRLEVSENKQVILEEDLDALWSITSMPCSSSFLLNFSTVILNPSSISKYICMQKWNCLPPLVNVEHNTGKIVPRHSGWFTKIMKNGIASRTWENKITHDVGLHRSNIYFESLDLIDTFWERNGQTHETHRKQKIQQTDGISRHYQPKP